MGIYISAILLMTYITFVFFSENFNPLKKPAVYVFRRRWRYGRRMALCVLASAFVAGTLYSFAGFDFVAAGCVALCEFTLLWWFFTRPYSTSAA